MTILSSKKIQIEDMWDSYKVINNSLSTKQKYTLAFNKVYNRKERTHNAKDNDYEEM